jgi:hypothetical protein
VLTAKQAIADYLAVPLAKLPPEQLEWNNTLVETSSIRKSSVCGLFKWRQFEPEVILLAVG